MRAGVAFVPAVLLAVVITTIAAVIVGFPALRIPGLYLAVTTLGSRSRPRRGCSRVTSSFPTSGSPSTCREKVFGISLGPQRTYYALCLIVVFFVLMA